MKSIVKLIVLLLAGLAAAQKGRREAPEHGEKLHTKPPHIEPLFKTNTDSVCDLPMKVGSCRAAFPRFFYNASSQTCVSFIYGGCGSNGNNFLTRKECEATCNGTVLPNESTSPPSGKSARMAPLEPLNSTSMESIPLPTEIPADDRTEHCEAEPVVGPCKAAFQRWYFNKKTVACQQFIYGGCRGNKNNYHTEESCKSACIAAVVLPSSKKRADNEDFCSVTPDPGPCRAAFPMYFYDPNSASCQSFMYGGCRGNMNRFGTVEECLSRCSSDGEFIRLDQNRSRWTTAAFLFTTLAIISVLLLVTLVIITLRRNRLPRRSFSISDKEELLPDEQSSVDSLSLPESPTPPQTEA